MIRILGMIALIAAGLAALVLTLPEPERVRVSGPSAALAVTGVTVFDGERFLADQTILIQEGHIAAMGDALTLPAGVQRLDGTGLTALPGLIDAHTQSWGEALETALAFGVTTHLDMFSPAIMLPAARAMRDDLIVHDQADLFSSGMLATVEGGHGTQFGVAVETLSGPGDAEAWVEARMLEGSDYIKLVYIPDLRQIPSLDLETAQAVIDAAHARGLMAVAHVAHLEAARELVASGIDGLVHIFADAPVDADFIAAARAADIFVIPTLTVIASVAGTGEGQALAADPRVANRLSAGALRTLEGGFGSPAGSAFQYPLAEANVRRLYEAGVPILAGSDALNPGAVYGASVHHEIQLLRRAGLTPVDALRAATSVPANAFALDGRGRIAPGARADLVLIEGDPRTDPGATLSIAAVIRNGVLVGDEGRAEPGLESTALQTADIGAFDTVTNGFSWSETTDAMMGGASQAEMALVDGVLRTTVSVRAGFPFPWAGPGYFPAESDAASLDLSGLPVLVLRLRATPGAYRVMLFNPQMSGTPPTVTLRLGEAFEDIRLDLSAVDGFDPASFAGLAIVAGPDRGDALIELAAARFEPAP
jgi:imidazolonepropionase-like amidohydrolase